MCWFVASCCLPSPRFFFFFEGCGDCACFPAGPSFERPTSRRCRQPRQTGASLIREDERKTFFYPFHFVRFCLILKTLQRFQVIFWVKQTISFTWNYLFALLLPCFSGKVFFFLHWKQELLVDNYLPLSFFSLTWPCERHSATRLESRTVSHLPKNWPLPWDGVKKIPTAGAKHRFQL